MHRTSSRPAPLDFLLPSAHPTYGIDRRKDIGLPCTRPQLTPIYFEAPVKGGLRTPPADEMATAYQQPQYNNYTRRQDTVYSTPTAPVDSYGGAYSGGSGQAVAYSAANQPPPASASTLRMEVQSSQYVHSQPSSPQPAIKTSALAPSESVARRKSANSDMILPNLQIPQSINNSGGSLAEFAAQVCTEIWNLRKCILT